MKDYRARGLLVCLAFVGLSGCRENSDTAPVSTRRASAVAPVTDPAKAVAGIIVGAPRGPDARPSPQITDQPVLVTISLNPGVTKGRVVAKLIDLEHGDTVATQSADVSPRSGDVHLALEHPQPLKATRHLLEVTLDAKLVGHVDVDVQDAALLKPKN